LDSGDNFHISTVFILTVISKFSFQAGCQVLEENILCYILTNGLEVDLGSHENNQSQFTLRSFSTFHTYSHKPPIKRYILLKALFWHN